MGTCKAFNEGYEYFIRGNLICPYDESTDEYWAWIDGYQEAEMDMEL